MSDRKNATEDQKQKFQKDVDDLLPLADAFVQYQINIRNPFAEGISRGQIKHCVAEFYTEMHTFGIDDMIKRYKP